MIANETGWCKPWEVADTVPAEWADRYLAYRTALADAEKQPRQSAVGQTVQMGKTRKTRVI